VTRRRGECLTYDTRYSGLQKLKAQLLGPRHKAGEITGKREEEVDGMKKERQKTERKVVREYRGSEEE
jgi:hypothetical protein